MRALVEVHGGAHTGPFDLDQLAMLDARHDTGHEPAGTALEGELPADAKVDQYRRRHRTARDEERAGSDRGEQLHRAGGVVVAQLQRIHGTTMGQARSSAMSSASS